jgi:hypothetical protein
MRRVPSSEKLHALTGFRPQTGLAEIIACIIGKRKADLPVLLSPIAPLPDWRRYRRVTFMRDLRSVFLVESHITITRDQCAQLY